MEPKVLKRENISREVPLTKGKNVLISDDAIKFLNFRIEKEELSSRLYLTMAMWLNNNGYPGAYNLWNRYSKEELIHADWARTYLLSFGVQPLTPKLEQLQQTYTGLPQIIQLSFDHEIEVSQEIKQMANMALSKADHILYDLCLNYLREQVEEHNKTQNWVDQLHSFGTDKTALRLLDHAMNKMSKK